MVGAVKLHAFMTSPCDHRAISEVKQRWSVIGRPKIYYLELLRASEGTLSR
jgi:hypothetical protein